MIQFERKRLADEPNLISEIATLQWEIFQLVFAPR